MGYTDGQFALGLPGITNSNTAAVSPYVHDAQAAKILFGAGQKNRARVQFRAPVSADTTAVRIDFVASDAAALNSGNIVLGSHYTSVDELGDALGTGTQNIAGDFEIGLQTTAKQYYGALVTLSGTNPDMTAGDAYVVRDAQNYMLGARAAVPA